ncbi:MAG: hypothetical protein FWD22_04570 [Treponema sp.]|nr:hypothetical protein [Treponema sp.]
MIIRINNQALDFTLDKEKTLGDVFTGIEQWLSSSGHRLSEISVDGQVINASMIEDIFSRDINTVKFLDINTNVIAELTAASLLNLLEDISEYESLDFENKTKFLDTWKGRPQAQFMYAEMPDLYSFFINTFSNNDISPAVLRSITEEIQREVNDPVNEITKIEPVLNEICIKLTDLPLDIQTGKDLLAAQTLQLFSAITEKIIRIFYQLNSQCYLTDKNEIKKIAQDFSDFKNVLKELLEAYEKNDTVIVGDLAEYEAAPRLKEIYTSILKNSMDPLSSKNFELKDAK